jgi:hypothetical protein
MKSVGEAQPYAQSSMERDGPGVNLRIAEQEWEAEHLVLSVPGKRLLRFCRPATMER